jgi:hypothetical protein
MIGEAFLIRFDRRNGLERSLLPSLSYVDPNPAPSLCHAM